MKPSDYPAMLSNRMIDIASIFDKIIIAIRP
jgi:hypothetical protein